MSGEGSLFPLVDDQARGVEPGDNVWLAASAGTGKTQVLTGRVLRLLLQPGVEPGRILGLTFTKAGAAEMAGRVRKILAEWVQLAEPTLRKQLAMIGADPNDPAVIARARTRFAAVIDAPGQGLAFQTIHSFCQSLLGAFPLEAGLTPGFRAIEDNEAALIRRELLDTLANTAHTGHNLPFLDDLGALSETLGESETLRWLDRCAKASGALLRLPPAIAPQLRHWFDLPLADPDEWLTRWCAAEADETGWQAIMGAYLAWSAPTGAKMATIIGDWLAAAPPQRAATLATVLTTIYKADGDLRSEFGKKLADVGDIAQRCGEAAREALRRANAMAASDRYARALSAGRTVAAAWATHKQRAGLVEFDDLIVHAMQLLDGDGSADWIRYKLDQRIDHILVDEAQDTNAVQWTIIKRLAEEYFAGEGVRDPALRTLFVVGDTKQAIFGFQGTDPLHFHAAEQWFRARGRDAERRFADLAIATSYRCAPAVLDAVDAVAATLGPEQFGLDAGAAIHHLPAPGNSGGAVTLWPVEAASAADSEIEDVELGEEGWIDDATRRLADRIARQVRRWIDHGHDGSEVEPGDVLVLVRKRKELAGLIVARLQARGVPVAGVDRLSLDKPLAVRDLLTAARFALQPLDDLNLANLLVSPLVGFSQDDLWRHGAGRGATPLWRHLREQPDLAERLAPLRSLLAMADYVSPYVFFETIMSGPMQGRAKLLARLGNAARDPLEELMSQALAFGRDEGPSLHRFLRWFDNRDNEIKRETDVASGEARVMTVHGAKGLEARFVILADAAGNPDARQGGGLSWTVDDGLVLPVTGFRKQDQPQRLVDAELFAAERERREHWRLLYVAMTRAKEALFVTGTLGLREKEPAADSWYRAIADSFGRLNAASIDDPLWGMSLVHARRRDRRRLPRATPAAPPPLSIPDWVSTPPPEEPRPLRPLSPSAIADDAAMAVPQPPVGDSAAARRGTLIHALFERLPAVARERRRDAALHWLEGQAPDFDQAQRRGMVDVTMTVMEDARFAALFGPEALAEAPLSALVDGRVIAGTVDRLLVGEEVLVVDFKTGAQVPDSAEQVPPAYLRQMAAYRAALAVIFAGKPVRAGLLYTAAPRLIELPDALLDAHRPGE